MHVQLISQPRAGQRNVIDFLREVLADKRVTSLDIVVAWLKRSGMRQASDLLAEFRERGGYVRLIVGISQGGATRQGLEQAILYSDEAFVFHDPSGRTFHPKLYHARGEGISFTIVGSQNFTRGGLVENHELGVEIHADLLSQDDADFVDDIEHNINWLLNESESVLRLTNDSLQRIIESGVVIGDEDRQNSDVTPRTPTSGREVVASLFGRVAARLRRARGATSSASSSGAPRAADPTIKRPAPRQPGSEVVRRWFKELDTSNAQRLPEGRNPTGHLTLTRAGFDIAWAQYFRDELFAECSWKPAADRANREYVMVDFRVITGGRDHGILTLQVDHYPDFGSNQGNRTSTVRWGPTLNRYLRQEVDHTRDYVTIEAMADGTFALTIASAPTGRAIL